VRRLRLFLKVAAVTVLVLSLIIYAFSWHASGGWVATVNGKPIEAHVFAGSRDRFWVTFPKGEWESEIVWERARGDVFQLNPTQGIDCGFFLIAKPDKPFGVSYMDTSKNDDRAQVSSSRITLSVTVDKKNQLVLKHLP
jgi:hypothetical protein